MCVCVYIYIYACVCRGYESLASLCSGVATIHLHQLLHLSCDNHTHTPAQKKYTNFIMMYPFVISRCSTNWPGHGHGYEWHGSSLLHSWCFPRA